MLRLGARTQCTDDATHCIEIRAGERTITALPLHVADVHLAQRKREERQRPRCRDHLVEQRIHQGRRIEVQHACRGRFLDHVAQGGARHQRHDVAPLLPELGEPGPIEVRLEVGAQRDHDAQRVRMCLEQAREQCHRALTVAGASCQRDHLLELVDDDHQLRVRVRLEARSHEGGNGVRRRPFHTAARRCECRGE